MKKYIKTAVIFLLCAFSFTTGNLCFDRVTAEPVVTVTTKINLGNGTVNPMNVVANPKAYLNKRVIMDGKFDKFSTLGLDYKPAFKSSEDYISFLIKRNDTSYDIPLSEMKLFMKRDMAEKFIDLKTEDEIRITGLVFSDALGDAWVDVEGLVITKKAPEKDGVK